jgi:hypothetical protein
VLSSAANCLWKSFRRSRTPFRDRPETVRLHPGSGVHLHPGILFEIIPEHRSESYRNRVHLASDSPSKTLFARRIAGPFGRGLRQGVPKCFYCLRPLYPDRIGGKLFSRIAGDSNHPRSDGEQAPDNRCPNTA